MLFSYALKEVRSKQEETRLEVVYKVAEIGANYQPIKNHVDAETDKKNPAVKAAKTTLNAKSKFAINTWALTLKIKTPNKFARYYKKNVDVETIEKNPAGKGPQDEAVRQVQARHHHVGPHSQDQDPQQVRKLPVLRSPPWKARRWNRRPQQH